MKKLLILFLLLIAPVYAIDWTDVVSVKGRHALVDKDSIKEFKGYYFYNIKFANKNPDDVVVITMQSSIKRAFSARTKSYTPSQYDALNGDYDNITSNYTENLEPVTYDSLAYACYKKVKEIQQKQKASGITF